MRQAGLGSGPGGPNVCSASVGHALCKPQVGPRVAIPGGLCTHFHPPSFPQTPLQASAQWARAPWPTQIRMQSLWGTCCPW